MLSYPSQIKYQKDTNIYSIVLEKHQIKPYNRWYVWAFSVAQLFKYSEQNIDYLKIGVTVGFDTDIVNGNNRIGIIFCLIKNDSIDNIAKQLETQVLANKYHALATYDMLRNHDTTYLRKYFSNCG